MRNKKHVYFWLFVIRSPTSVVNINTAIICSIRSRRERCCRRCFRQARVKKRSAAQQRIELTRLSSALSGRRMHCCKSLPVEITFVRIARIPAMCTRSAMPAISWNYIIPLLDLSPRYGISARTRLSSASQQEIQIVPFERSDYRLRYDAIFNVKNPWNCSRSLSKTSFKNILTVRYELEIIKI